MADIIQGFYPVPAIDVAKITSGRFGMPRMPDGTLGQVLTGQGAGVDPVYAAAGAGYPMKLKPAVPRWVLPGWYVESEAPIAAGEGFIFYIPIYVSEITTYIRIATYVEIGAVGTADLRIFAWSDGVPGALILSAGTVDTETAGEKEIIISQELSPGYYFLAIRCTGAPTLYGPDPLSAVVPPVPGFAEVLGTNVWRVVLYAIAEYADPAPAPTGGASVSYAMVTLREN